MTTVGNREKILTSARDLLYKQGYMRTSVDDIASAAGVSKSNFYYHFPAKEDLGVAVLESRRTDFEALVHGSLHNIEVGPDQRLASLLSALIRLQVAGQYGCPFGNLAAEMAEHSERFRCYISGMFEAMTDLIADVVSEAQTAGTLRRDMAPGMAAALVVQTIQGMHLIAKCSKSSHSLTASAQALMQLLREPQSCSNCLPRTQPVG